LAEFSYKDGVIRGPTLNLYPIGLAIFTFIMDRQTHRQLEKQSIFIDIGDKYKICWMFKYILYWRIKINWI